MQNKITKRSKLLDEKGELLQKGYATELILDYDRKAIKASGMRIKEWDYYYVGNSEYGLCVTIADNSYHSLYSVTLMDFTTPKDITKSFMQFFTFGKIGLPESSVTGNVEVRNKNYFISFENDGVTRRLICDIPDFSEGKRLKADVVLTDFPADSIVMATPFKNNPKAFYYNQKINCMRADGMMEFDEKRYSFGSHNDSFGTLDWGRGVWTYKNSWFWGSLSAALPNGDTFGFNIGYGFGDTAAASENVVFYNGKAHKLSLVLFNIPKTEDGKDDFMSDWTFTSDDGRFEMNFKPIINRHANLDFKIICSIQNQVFGRFSGKVILDDGTEVNITDAVGFAEKVFNKW